jgi:hypothetical protein
MFWKDIFCFGALLAGSGLEPGKYLGWGHINRNLISFTRAFFEIRGMGMVMSLPCSKVRSGFVHALSCPSIRLRSLVQVNSCILDGGLGFNVLWLQVGSWSRASSQREVLRRTRQASYSALMRWGPWNMRR